MEDDPNDLTLFDLPGDEPQPTPSLDDFAHRVAGAARKYDPNKEPSEAAIDQGWGKVPEKVIIPTEELFIQKGFTWVPHTRGEASLAVKGIDGALERLNSIQAGSLVKRMETYKNQAGRSIVVLRDGLEDPDNKETVRVDLIKTNTLVMDILARHQYYAGALNADDLPVRHRSKKITRGVIQAHLGVVDSPDESLLKLWEGVWQSSVDRSKFWHNQLDIASHDHRVEMYRAEERDRARSIGKTSLR